MEGDNKIHSYVNGNYTVDIYSDGTKTRTTEHDNFLPDFPESIDIKITDYCDLGCRFCHEMSTTNGKHSDLAMLLTILHKLPVGIELAIGGGNPLSHPRLAAFLKILVDSKFIPSITVNQKHIEESFDLLKFLIRNNRVYGVGVSVTPNTKDFDSIKRLVKLSNNVVFHVIAGVHSFDTVKKLTEIPKCKILILGYKKFGRGENYYSGSVESNIVEWRNNIRDLFNKCIVSFDNLAIEQLEIEKILTKKAWEEFYMGDDFSFTMYIDAVNQNFAKTSRSPERTSWKGKSLLQFFKEDK